MPLVLQDLVQSKKFIFVLLVTFAVLAAGTYGAMTKPEVLAVLGVLWPVYLGAQGVADIGAKIADGRVQQETMASERVANLLPLIQQFFPLMLEKMTPPAPPTVGYPRILKALAKGDRVRQIAAIGTTDTEGEVLIDYPEVSTDDILMAPVRCRFGGVEGDHLRVSLYRPTKLPVPSSTETEAKAS